MKTELERAVGEILIDADVLRGRIAELGEEVSAHYVGQDLLLIGTSMGGARPKTVGEDDDGPIGHQGVHQDRGGLVHVL